MSGQPTYCNNGEHMTRLGKGTWACVQDCEICRIADLERRLAESKAGAAAMGEALLDVRNSLGRVWAAIGDELGSRALGGKGLAKKYLQSVSSEVEAAERKAEEALSAVAESRLPR